MIGIERNAVFAAPHLILFPGAAIVITCRPRCLAARTSNSIHVERPSPALDEMKPHTMP